MKSKRNIFVLLIILFSVSIFSQKSSNIKWWNPQNSKTAVIQNQAWSNKLQSIYHRLPAKAESKVRDKVWNLSKNSAGLSIQFQTNSQNISVKPKFRVEASA